MLVIGEDRLEVVDVVAADHVGDLSAHDAAFCEGERGEDELLDETPRRLGIAEVDVAGRREEVGEDDASQPLRELGRRFGADERREPRREEDGRRVEDARQAVEAHVREQLARLRREHQLEVLVGPQRLGRRDDAPDEEVLVAVRLRQVGVQLGEELTVLALAQGLVDVVLAAGKQAVHGRSRAPGLGGDVVDRDLRHPPALAARLHRIEHPILEREVEHEASVSHN